MDLITSIFEGIIDFITSFFGGSIITGGVLVYLHKHPDETEKWLAIIFKILSYIWKGFKYQRIKYDIQSRVNGFVKTLNDNSATNFPKISIKWAGKDNEEVIWEKDRILLVIRDKKHHIKNLVHASHLFVSETLLRRSKVHITKSQKVSLDLFSVKLILEKSSPEALEHFISGYFIPQLNKHDKVSEFIKQYINIEKAGLYFPVLIQELTFLGNTVYLENPNMAISEEVQKLVDFLEKFSQRKVGDTSDPETFTGRYIRCAIRIVASEAVRKENKIEGRRQLIEFWIRNGYSNIYLIGSKDNREFISNIIFAVQTTFPDIQMVKEYSFKAEINASTGKRIVDDVLVHLHYPKSTKYVFTEEEVIPTLLNISSEEELDKEGETN